MATKRKKSASTSSTFDGKFVNKVASKYFKEYMTTNKRIICEVKFEPCEMDGNLTHVLDERQWKTFAVLEGDANANIVREFYANLRALGTDGPVIVRGQEIDFSVETINQKFGLQSISNNEFQTMLAQGQDYDKIIHDMARKSSQWFYSRKDHALSRHLVSSSLNRYAQAWCRFIRENLMPTSQRTELTRKRVVLLYCILTGKTIDVGRIIHDNIAAYCEDSTTAQAAHIHPVLITHLCAATNIPLNSSNEVWLPQSVYGTLNIARTGKWPIEMDKPDGLGFFEPKDNDGAMEDQLPMPQTHEASSSAARPNTVTNENLKQMLEDQGRRLDNLTLQQVKMMKKFSTHQLRIERQQVSVERQIKFMLDHQQAQAAFYGRYVGALTATYESLHRNNPPIPPYPENLMQPYQPPPDDDHGYEPPPDGDHGDHLGTT